MARHRLDIGFTSVLNARGNIAIFLENLRNKFMGTVHCYFPWNNPPYFISPPSNYSTCFSFYLFLSLVEIAYRFSQSGNLNRHMRVHGTNGNNLITWQRQILRRSMHSYSHSRESHTSIYSSATSVSCAEEFQRLRPESTYPLYKSNFVNIFWSEYIPVLEWNG